MRPADLRAERNWLRWDRLRRADLAFYMGLLAYCGVPPPPPPRRRHQPLPPPQVVELPIVLSSDTSAEDLPAPQEPQQPAVVVMDLESLQEKLPDLDVTK